MTDTLERLELDATHNPRIFGRGGDASWFTQARFGLFIHWGIYAMAARHEQVQRREEMPGERYDRYAERFDPDLFDPDAWADLAARAGMKYMVFTTKHEDGFCMWDSQLTDFKITRTPYGRDVLGPLIEAMRARDIRIGLYYTQMDHHHPHFTVDDLHHLRNAPDRAALNAGRDMNIYRKYLHGQVRELLTQFGQIDILWFDGGNYMRSRKLPGEPWEGKCGRDWDEAGLLRMIRDLQPHVLINDRLGDGKLPGSCDFLCHEQALPAGRLSGSVDHDPAPVAGGGDAGDAAQEIPWESPQTFSGSWGYYRDEHTWKSAKQVLEMLIYTTGRGGNMLLNVGPTARGELDPRAVSRLSEIGDWMQRHSRSIHGCTAPPPDIAPPPSSALTWNPQRRRLYLHLLDWPATPGPRGACMHLYWRGFDVGRIAYAQLLHDASEVPVKSAAQSSKARMGGWPDDTSIFALPVQQPAGVLVPVVEIFLA